MRLNRGIALPAVNATLLPDNTTWISDVAVADRPSDRTYWEVSGIAFTINVICALMPTAVGASLLLGGFTIAQASLELIGAGDTAITTIWGGGANLASEVEIHPLDLSLAVQYLIASNASSPTRTGGQMLLSGSIEQGPNTF